MDLIMDFVKKYQKLLLLCFVMLIVFFIGSTVSKGQKRIAVDVDNKISQMKSQKLMMENAPDEGGLANLDGAAVGEVVDSSRLEADAKHIEDFCKTAFTFKNLDEYQSIRKNLMIDYKLSESSDFLRYFYPVVSTEETPGRYDYSPVKDGKYEMAFKSVASHVIYMHGTDYSYVSDVVVSGGEKEYRFIFVCSVDADGSLSNLSGHLVSE